MPLRVNSEGIHEKPDRALVTGFCNDNCRGVGGGGSLLWSHHTVAHGRVEIFNGYWFFQRFWAGRNAVGRGRAQNRLHLPRAVQGC